MAMMATRHPDFQPAAMREIADRMAVLRKGSVAEVGTADKLLEGENGRAPSFLERANRLVPSFRRAVGNGLLEVGWAGVRLLAADEARDFRVLTVLPSRVILGKEPPPGPEVNRFRGTVRRVMENESVWHVQVEVAGKLLMADVPASRWAHIALQPGERVHILIKLGDLNIF